MADAFAPPPRDHIREQKKDEEVQMGESDTGSMAYPRRRRPICPLLLSPTTTSARAAYGGGRSIRVLLLTMRMERGVGLRPPEKGTGVCC